MRTISPWPGPLGRTRSVSLSPGAESSRSGEDSTRRRWIATLVAERMVQIGLEPVVTLFHYTHPLWFHRNTPWTDPASVGSFARYARRVAEALGPAARVWTIFNEPLVFLLGGFVDGQIPPGISDPTSAGRALGHLLFYNLALIEAMVTGRWNFYLPPLTRFRGRSVYEWLEGYGPKFGLFEADRGSLERRQRGSVELFRELGKKFLQGTRSTNFSPD